MRLRVRIDQNLAASLSLLPHGLLALSVRLDKPVVPTSTATAREHRVELNAADEKRFLALKKHWNLSDSALIRAALLIAGTSHFNPAPLVDRRAIRSTLDAGGHIKRTDKARAYQLAAELFDQDGKSLGFATAGTIQSLRHSKDILLAS